MLRFDAASSSVVITCTDCPEWVELAADRPEAYEIGARHERAVHARYFGGAAQRRRRLRLAAAHDTP